MESTRQSARSSDRMSQKGNDGSSAVDRKKISTTDDSSTPSAVDRKKATKKDCSSTPVNSKHHCPDSRDPKSVTTVGDGSASAVSTKRHGKGVVSDEGGADRMLFADVTQGPHEVELRFRLIHFWEARNPHSKVLFGEELRLIDEKGTAIQGFIPSGRVDSFVPQLKAGCVYKLKNFFGSVSKENFRVADPKVTVTFSWNSVLTLLGDDSTVFPEDRFRFHGHDEFQANCGLRGDLYDFLGHIKLVEGQPIANCPKLDEVDIAAKRNVLLHVQTEGGPVMKLYLWDHAATVFCRKFISYGVTPSVILVTTVYPKHVGGTLALTSMSSSRMFMDSDIQTTREYLGWLSSNLDIANKVNVEFVTRRESVTISELLAYIRQENAKVAWFECTATIDDVHRGSAWYYISCGGCHSKATKGANTLICTNEKCKRSAVTGVPES